MLLLPEKALACAVVGRSRESQGLVEEGPKDMVVRVLDGKDAGPAVGFGEAIEGHQARTMLIEAVHKRPLRGKAVPPWKVWPELFIPIFVIISCRWGVKPFIRLSYFVGSYLFSKFGREHRLGVSPAIYEFGRIHSVEECNDALAFRSRSRD